MTTRVPGINWTGEWQRRSEARKRYDAQPNGRPRPYDRTTDPLLDVELAEVWEELTGDPLRGAAVRCPSPDHTDGLPSCMVHARLFHCHGCKASGSIIDLGALLYGIEPRGAGFFQIRNRLLADLGMADREAV